MPNGYRSIHTKNNNLFICLDFVCASLTSLYVFTLLFTLLGLLAPFCFPL